MEKDKTSMELLEEGFLSWARTRPDIRAAFVVGSRARVDHAADEWSDLDVGFTTTDPQRYLSSDNWLGEIADPWVSYPDPVGVTRHVLFDGGLDAGFTPIPHAKVRLAIRAVPVLRRFPPLFRLIPGGQQLRRDITEAGEYYRRGVRVILDKDGVAEKFLAAFPAGGGASGPPDRRAFLDTVGEFWLSAAWTCKHVRRGELWRAKTAGCDGRMKSLLLRMIEWHARASHGWDYDTWEGGRFLEEWADARAMEGLRTAFAQYDGKDIGRALLATMSLFRWLAVETATASGYPYPTSADQKVTEWVTSCLAGLSAA